jgi:broad specificity polyphosphatase/5'/3'-nucleotidase SurE
VAVVYTMSTSNKAPLHRVSTVNLNVPTVHINGTGKRELLEQLSRAAHALREADAALAQATPHDRDYYVQGPSEGPQARREHADRRARIQEVITELEVIAAEIFRQ